MADRPFGLERCTPHTGAIISGVDITRPLSDASQQRLQTALLEHGVIFFRDQPFDAASLARFAGAFGTLLVPTTLDPKYLLPDAPGIVRIHADADSRFVAGEDWHSDMTCNEAPPFGTILSINILPECGGDTCFANMHAAYDALSDGMKILLADKTALHDGARVFAKVNEADGRSYPRAVHPVIRTHPSTGRKAIFVNKQFTAGINEMPKDESAAILAFLYAHVAKPQFQMRFRWEKHSVAFWDNRCLQHTAVWDYFPHTRSGLRATLAGDRPV